jgi:hypothetical protein
MSSNFERHNKSYVPIDDNQLKKEKLIEIKRPNSGNNKSKMDLKLNSNSIFAFQEFDQFTTAFSNTNPSSIVKSNSNQSRKISNTNSSSSSSSSESQNEEEIPFPINSRKNKRLSDTSSLNNFLNKFKEFNMNISSPNNNIQQKKQQQLFPSQNVNINNMNNPNINNNNFNNFRRKSVQYYPNFNFLNFPNQNQQNFQNMNNPFMVNTNMNNYNVFNNIRNISIPIQNNIQTKTQKKRNSFSIPVPNYFYNEDQYMLDNLNSYLTDQTRCRQVQEKLEEKKNDPDFINKFYHNIESNLVDIIDHQFGNYVIQKFFNIILY